MSPSLTYVVVPLTYVRLPSFFPALSANHHPLPQDASTWTIPHGVSVSELRSRLSSAGVHPVFLLTNTTLEGDYRALVGEIGFGAVAAVDPADAVAANYNDDYLPRAMRDGLEVRSHMYHSNRCRRGDKSFSALAVRVTARIEYGAVRRVLRDQRYGG